METIISNYKAFTNVVNIFVRYLSIAFFIIMVIDVITSVFMRYVFVKPMVWGEQVAIYCMIWIAFLSASVAFRKGAHMGLDLLINNVPDVIREIIKWIANTLILGFLFIFTIWGFKHAYAVRFQSSPVVFNMSMFWAYLALPVGGVFMLIQEIGVIINGIEDEM